MSLIQYILVATACLSISYLAYLIFLKNETGFQQQRIFLVASLVFSLLLPVTGLRLNVASLFGNSTENPAVIQSLNHAYDIQAANPAETESFQVNIDQLINIYLVITALFLLIIGLQIIRILRLRRLSGESRMGRSLILTSKEIDSPFSFFSWIFVPENIPDGEEKNSIIVHESVHVSQYHSMDNLLIELIAAAMWFNPVVWMMKRSLHLVHEYLADEGTLGTGIDKIRYQALLINQVTGESLICLSSSFNQSLIKKRMIMMTKIKNNRQNRLKILTLLPLSAILFLMVALLNGLFPQKSVAGKVDYLPLALTDPQTSEVTTTQRDTTKKKSVKVVVINKAENIVINKAEDKDQEEEVKITLSSDSDSGDSITYIVNGDRVNDISDLNSDSIESVDVRKDVKTVIINYKKSSKSKPEEIVVSTGKNSLPDNVNYFINGEKATKEEVSALSPENIESISVEKMNTEGGKEGESEGTIRITTKDKAGKP